MRSTIITLICSITAFTTYVNISSRTPHCHVVLEYTQPTTQHQPTLHSNTSFYHHYNNLQAIHEQTQLLHMSTQTLQNYFFAHQYTEQEILNRIDLYQSDDFIALIKKFDTYATTITALYKQYNNASWFKKLYGIATNSYYRGFCKRLTYLYKELELCRRYQQTTVPQKTPSSLPSPTEQLCHILNSSNSFTSCAHHYEQIAYIALQNNNSFYPHLSELKHVIDPVIKRLYTSTTEQEFVFNCVFIEHILSNLDYVSTHKTPPASQLLKQAVIRFICNLNPVTQITQWIDSITTAAQFVASFAMHSLYSSPEEYRAYVHTIGDSLSGLSLENLANITTEQWIDIVAQCASDCVYAAGMTKLLLHLKKLETVNSLQQKTSHAVRKAKEALETALAKNNYIVHPDGTLSKYSPGKVPLSGNTAKQIVGNSLEHLQDAQKNLMATVKKDINKFHKNYCLKKHEFGSLTHKYIKIDYEHILGMELSFSKKGKPLIKGFHIDRMNTIEKSGIIEFSNKVIHKNGFYSAELLFNGHRAKYQCTFFPAHWSNEQVIDAIFEAYDEFIQKGGIPIGSKNGNYILRGNISTGETIDIVCTPHGKIKTAYPRITE